MAIRLFPDIPSQLNEMYDFISKVYHDLLRLNRILSNRELRKLVQDFRRGVEMINLICLKIVAKEKVNTDMGRELYIDTDERGVISEKINKLTDKLNELTQTDAMERFFGQYPVLAEKAYIKLYAEGVDDFYKEVIDEEENQEFLRRINAIVHYTKNLLSELDATIEKTF